MKRIGIKKKALSLILAFCMVISMLPALSLQASAADDVALSVILGAATETDSTYYYSNATVVGSGIKTILLSFSSSVANGDKIILPATSPEGFTISSTSASNDYTKRINIDSGADASTVQSYLQGIGFQLANTSQSVKVTVTTEDVQYDTFYDIDTQHYYQFIPYSSATGTTWVDAYNSAKSMTYMGRTGYLATITSYGEDTLVNSLSGEQTGWLGGTTLSNTGKDTDNPLYYYGFDTTSNENYWYWVCGPERGDIFYSARKVTMHNAGDDADSYLNWSSNEPSNSNSNENCLTTLFLSFGGEQGTAFSWNDISYSSTYDTGIYSPKGCFVEYGNLALGSNESVDTTKYASVSGSLSSTGYAASVSGNALSGQTLTAALTGGSGSEALTYQWLRGDAAISGATDATYTLTDADVGYSVAVKITVNSSTTLTSPYREPVTAAPPVAGSGNALSFDGTNYVDLGESNSNLILGNTFTEEAWVYPSETDDKYHGILGNQISDDPSTRAPGIWVYDYDKIHIGFGNGTDWCSLVYPNAVLTPYEWNHIAVVYDGNTYYLYINGVLKVQETLNATPCNTPVRFIGKVDNFLTGHIDEVKLWSTARTQDEIEQDMHDRYVSDSALVGYWNFDEGSGTTVTDLSATKNTGTLTNTDDSAWVNSGAWQKRATAQNVALVIDAGYSPDGGNVMLASTSNPSNGTLSFSDANKTVTYTPTADFFGTDSFTYTVTNADNVSSSYTVNMTVVQNPVMTGPTDVTAAEGASEAFTVTVSAPLTGITYQWQKYNGSTWDNITNATDATYTLDSVTAEDAGQYRCVATNTDGIISAQTTSDTAMLTVAYSSTTYSVSLDTNGGTINSGNITAYTYGAGATLPTNVIKSDSDFTGWYVNSDFSGNPVTSISTTDTGDKSFHARWNYTVSGTVTDDAVAAASYANVTIRGNNITSKNTTADTDGYYSFSDIPSGEYNIVAVYNGVTKTILITVDDSDITDANIAMPDGAKNSLLEIASDTPDVVVGYLDQQFTNSDNEYIGTSGNTVEIKLNVDEQSEDEADGATDIQTLVDDQTINMYLDMTLTKTKTGGTISTDTLSSSESLLKIIIPYDLTGKTNVAVYRYHNGAAEAMTEATYSSDMPADECYMVNTSGNQVVIWTKSFSTYAISYLDAYTVSYDDNGATSGSVPDSINVSESTVWSSPGNSGSLAKTGYNFKGWALTDSATSAVSTYTITGDTTFYAVWSSNSSSSHSSSGVTTQYTITATVDTSGSINPIGSVSVTKGGSKTFAITANDGYDISDVLVDGNSVGAVSSYTFSSVAAAHTIKAVFTKMATGTDETSDGLPYYYDDSYNKVFIGFASNDSGTMKYIAPVGTSVLLTANPKNFTDISGHWAKSYINFVTERELFIGTGNNLFSPDIGMTRAMFTTVIGRLYERSYGAMESSAAHDFTDCDYEAWYGSYIDWCSANGIIEGVGDGIFEPDREITRQEMVTILYRFANFLKVSEVTVGAVLSYPDSADIDSWGQDAALYCQKTGIIAGRNNGNFAPKETATRVEVAAILERFIEQVV